MMLQWLWQSQSQQNSMNKKVVMERCVGIFQEEMFKNVKPTEGNLIIL